MVGTENDFIRYAKIQQQYENIYGPQVCVLFQCGSFFEIFSCEEDKDGYHGCDVDTIADILNICSSQRNKKRGEKSTRHNPKLCGFPSVQKDKYASMLTENGYTVVIVEQLDQNTKTPRREITHILSPSTNENTTCDKSMLLTLYITESTNKGQPFLIFGAALIDTIHGFTYAYEPVHTTDMGTIFEEIQTLYSQFHPNETVIYGDIGTHFTPRYIVQQINDRAYNWCNLYTSYSKDKQRVVLSRYAHFHDTLQVSAIENIGLEMYPNALRAYVGMIEFVYLHKEHLIHHLEPPTILSTSNTLTLSSNTLTQLDISTHLMKLLNTCKTSMGRREFEWRIKHPMTNPQTIRERHLAIQSILPSYQVIRVQLKGIVDIERYVRKISMSTIQPFEIVQFVYSCEQATAILQQWCPHLYDISINDCISYIYKTLNNNKASKYSYETVCERIFNEGVSDIIDREHSKMTEAYGRFEEAMASLNTDCAERHFHIEKNEIDGYYLKGTRKRFNDLLKRRDEEWLNNLKTQPVSSKSNEFKIYLPDNDELNRIIRDTTQNIASYTKSVLQNTIIPEIYQWNSALRNLCDGIRHIDCISACAYNAVRLNHTQPNVYDREERSWIHTNELRHPLVEQNPDVIYKPVSIHLGQNDEQIGTLLFGQNGSGKSSTMKAIGIGTILAQSGMYVPATTFDICPYTQLFSRFPTGDAILRGKSTFILEMADVRNIIYNANANTLVIGDEIASGTESMSSLSIVGSSLTYLVNRLSSFIFASHMVELTKLDSITELKGLQFKHLHVYRDPQTNEIVYDRTLKDGAPPNHAYGLEIASTLGFPNEFINTAFSIRHEVEQTRSLKATRYNSSTYAYDTCRVCGDRTEEVHHIVPQNEASKEGFVSWKSVHHPSNLVSVCADCHDNIHYNKIHINGWYETSNGWRLSYQILNNQEDSLENAKRLRRDEGLSYQEIYRRTGIRKRDITI